MALTKTQINYLENKINRVVQEKKQEFRKDFNDITLESEVLKRFQNGKIKLLSKADLIKLFEERLNGGYYFTLSIDKLMDKETVEEIKQEIEQRQQIVDEYSMKLEKIKTKILDKIVLEGVDLDTALAEFDNIK